MSEEEKPSERGLQKLWDLTYIFWVSGSVVCIFYLVVVYLLPLLEVFVAPQIPLKVLIEIVICVIPIGAAVLASGKRIRLDRGRKSLSSNG